MYPAAKLTKIAIPPRRGMFPECILREFTSSYIEYFLQNFIISGMRMAETAKAEKK